MRVREKRNEDKNQRVQSVDIVDLDANEGGWHGLEGHEVEFIVSR